MEKQLQLQIRSAIIIQRNFRKYLSAKHSSERFKRFDVDNSKEILQIQRNLQKFYDTVHKNCGREKYINHIISQADTEWNKIKDIKNLESAEKANVIQPSTDIYEEGKRRHLEKLKCLQLPWWKKLD